MIVQRNNYLVHSVVKTENIGRKKKSKQSKAMASLLLGLSILIAMTSVVEQQHQWLQKVSEFFDYCQKVFVLSRLWL